MPRFELRFNRSADNVTQTVSIDAATISEAVRVLPPNLGIDRGQLWCDGDLLVDLEKAEGDTGTFWIISGTEKQGT